jgi:hypothetical protein
MGIEQIGFVEGDRDGPIELPVSPEPIRVELRIHESNEPT